MAPVYHGVVVVTDHTDNRIESGKKDTINPSASGGIPSRVLLQLSRSLCAPGRSSATQAEPICGVLHVTAQRPRRPIPFRVIRP